MNNYKEPLGEIQRFFLFSFHEMANVWFDESNIHFSFTIKQNLPSMISIPMNLLFFVEKKA